MCPHIAFQIVCAEAQARNLGMKSLYLKTSICFQKSPPWRAYSKISGFGAQKCRLRADGSCTCIWRKNLHL